MHLQQKITPHVLKNKFSPLFYKRYHSLTSLEAHTIKNKKIKSSRRGCDSSKKQAVFIYVNNAAAQYTLLLASFFIYERSF